jgi:hypothetical protein
MDLQPYIESVRHGVTNAAALADETTQQVANRLGAAIESSTRLALIQALSDAAGAISADLAPASVEVRMSGQDPEFVVSLPTASGEPTLLLPESEPSPTDEVESEDEPLARISLRLPNSVKLKVDEMAARDGISTNAWLIRAVVEALAERRQKNGWPAPPRPPGRPIPPLAGVFGENGPFGPNGIFGPDGPLGGGDRAEGRHRNRDRKWGGTTGGVQGWVR